MKRRTFLRGLGGAAVGAGVIGTGTAQQHGGDRLSGTRIHRFEPAGGAYTHEERFRQRSGGLVSEHGRSAVSLGRDELTTELYERLHETAFERQKEGAVSVTELPGGGFEVRYRDTAAIDTVGAFATQEQQLRSQLRVEPEIYVDFPLHVYKGDDPDDQGDLVEKTGPINVGWDVGKDASQIESDTLDWPHPSMYISGTRYVIDDGTIKSENEEMGWNLWPYDVPHQYHVRVYDVDSFVSPVVGQAHRDPPDHGWILDPDWEFADSRDYVSSASPWDDNPMSTLSVDNDGPYDDSTCQGKFDRIR